MPTTYPYAAKGAPTVGNGLGGLPRRIDPVVTATTVAANPAYDLQYVAKSASSFGGNSPSQMSPAIMLNGKIWRYWWDGSNSYRWTANYGASGLSSESLYTFYGTLGSWLPMYNGSIRTTNYCWSIELSSTTGLYCYTGINPFYVTQSGSDLSYVQPVLPNAGTYGNGGSWSGGLTPYQPGVSVVLSNGNFTVFALDSNSQIAILEYTPTMTFVRAVQIMYLPNNPFYYSNLVIRKTSFGYIVGFVGNDGATSKLQAVSLDSTLSPIASSQVLQIIDAYGYEVRPLEMTAGSDGVIATCVTFQSGYTIKAAIGAIAVASDGTFPNLNNIYLYTTGASGISSNIADRAYSWQSKTGPWTGQGAAVKNGNDRYGTKQAAYLGWQDYGAFSHFLFNSSGVNNNLQYLDYDTKPYISAQPAYNANNYTNRVGDFSSTLYCAMDILETETTQGLLGICADNNGYVFIGSTYYNYFNVLFKKVQRK